MWFSGVPVGDEQWPGVMGFIHDVYLYWCDDWCGSQVCLLETSNGQVWAGSRDTVVYVIDNRDVITCTKTLLVHSDMVVAMTTIARNRY